MRRRRGWRTAILLASILCVVCVASLLVYRGGIGVLERRADEELTYKTSAGQASVQDRVEQIVVVLEVLSGQEHNRSILAKDPDDEIGKALRTTLGQRDLFTELSCLDRTGEVVASSRYEDVGTTARVPPEVQRALIDGGRAHFAREGRCLTVTVPVHYQFDELELIGFIRAKAEFKTLLVDEDVSLSRITSSEGEVLAERAFPRAHTASSGRLVDHVHTFGSPDLATRAVPIVFPPGSNDPHWTMEVAECGLDLLVEASVLQRMVLLLTSGTAGLVLALVLLFSIFEGRLIDRLAERARELGILNEKLDRSRADLVKAARIAGMSEVATGILHNVGNRLNSLTTAAHQVDRALPAAKVSDLQHLVGFLQREEDEFAVSIRSHSKGGAFLTYLSELTRELEADHVRARNELGCVQSSIDSIQAIVSSQQQLVTRSSFREPTAPCDLMEGALVISDQVLGSSSGLRVERDFEAMPDVLIDKHRVIEILVHLVNNARHALEAARPALPVLALRIQALEDRKVRLQVTDNGVGIPAENLVKIFHHGFSTRPAGNGFGLHAAINTARELGGSLGAESAGPGLGSTFTLELPWMPLPTP
ncbi:MAG: sensor histidine kinase [Planctomycetota bacterium]